MRATFPARKTEYVFLFLEMSYPLVNRNFHLSVILRFQVLYLFEPKYRAQKMPVTISTKLPSSPPKQLACVYEIYDPA